MTVVLYGASGYTGRLVAAELRRRGVEHVLSGRDPAKLEPVGAEHGTPVRPVGLDDETGLRDLLADAGVVINCAGPFTLSGDALVRAAVDSGTHYVDSAGEQSFIQTVFERHGGAAERAGIALVPAIGFDFLPGDCIARLAAEGHEPLEELVIAYNVDGFGMSRGTLRSALEAMQNGGVIYDGGDWRPAPFGVFRASFDFPEPLGHQTMSRYPSGEATSVLRHTRTRRVVSMLRPAPLCRSRLARSSCPTCSPGSSWPCGRPCAGLLAGGAARCSPRGRRRPTAVPRPGRSLWTRAARTDARAASWFAAPTCTGSRR